MNDFLCDTWCRRDKIYHVDIMYHISCIPISWDNIVNAVQFCSQFLTKFTAYRPYFIMFIFIYLLYMTGLWGEICPVIVDSVSSQARRPYHAESKVVKVVVDMNLIHINNDLYDFWQTFISGSHTTFNGVYVDRERTEHLWFYLCSGERCCCTSLHERDRYCWTFLHVGEYSERRSALSTSVV